MNTVLRTDSHFITVKLAKMSYPTLLALSDDRRLLKLQLSDRNET